jgi:hypothetical protein
MPIKRDEQRALYEQYAAALCQKHEAQREIDKNSSWGPQAGRMFISKYDGSTDGTEVEEYTQPYYEYWNDDAFKPALAGGSYVRVYDEKNGQWFSTGYNDVQSYEQFARMQREEYEKNRAYYERIKEAEKRMAEAKAKSRENNINCPEWNLKVVFNTLRMFKNIWPAIEKRMKKDHIDEEALQRLNKITDKPVFKLDLLDIFPFELDKVKEVAKRNRISTSLYDEVCYRTLFEIQRDEWGVLNFRIHAPVIKNILHDFGTSEEHVISKFRSGYFIGRDCEEIVNRKEENEFTNKLDPAEEVAMMVERAYKRKASYNTYEESPDALIHRYLDKGETDLIKHFTELDSAIGILNTLKEKLEKIATEWNEYVDSVIKMAEQFNAKMSEFRTFADRAKDKIQKIADIRAEGQQIPGEQNATF